MRKHTGATPEQIALTIKAINGSFPALRGLHIEDAEASAEIVLEALVPSGSLIIGPDEIAALRRTLRFVDTVMQTVGTFESPELAGKLTHAQADWDTLAALIRDGE